jgi:HD-GYP domain-containing protein (c-di-GMP phosphodiesterase class II)
MVRRTGAEFRGGACRLLSRLSWKDRHVRLFCLLAFSQAACLALGLWLESRFIGSLPPAQGDVALGGSPASAAVVSGERPAGGPGDERASEASAGAIRALAFFWITVLQATVAYLMISRMRTEASRRQLVTTNESLQRQNDLVRTRDAVIFGLAKLAESRDPETGNHLERIALYSTRMASAVHRRSRYRRQTNPTFVKLIGISSALHDIGKVGVADSVLLKPGKLNREERELMEKHAEIGGKCIKDIELRLGQSNFLRMAREIAISHHERWDGTGYPHQLAGERIPLSARIVAICDVYDALASRRVYKERFPHEKCVKIIREGAGSRFDPALVDVFLEIESEFRGIALRCADPVADREADPDGTAGLEKRFAPAADLGGVPGIPDDSFLGPSSGLPLDVDLPT